MSTRRRFIVPVLTVLGLWSSSGCSLVDGDGKSDPLEARALHNFRSCDEMMSYSREHILEMLEASWEGDFWWGEEDLDVPGADDGAEDNDAGGEQKGDDESGGDPEHSDTNVQEQGVDEPDIVKTDGRRIIAVSGSSIHVVDVSGPSPILTDTLEIEGTEWGGEGEIFLHGDKVLLMDRSVRQDVPVSAWPAAWAGSPESWNSVVRVQEFDISVPGEARLLRRFHVDGQYISARKIGGVVRLVLTSQPSGLDLKSPWEFLESDVPKDGGDEPDVPPDGGDGDVGEPGGTTTGANETAGSDPGDPMDGGGAQGRSLRQADDAWEQAWEEAKVKARAHNEQVLANATEANILPSFVREDFSTGVSVVENGRLMSCDQAMRPGVKAGVELLSVMTLDLEAGIAPGSALGIMASGSEVYAGEQGLYVSTQDWHMSFGVGISPDVGVEDGGVADGGDDGMVEIDPAPGGDTQPESRSLTLAQVDQTQDQDVGARSYIHKFDISNPAFATYVASGEVDGKILNQFAMSEKDGNLRVAATRYSANSWEPLDSFVAVLAPQAEELVEIGRAGGLGLTERIYSVRFMGDVGYVVTFRQTDPLYTLDLSNPIAPRVLGELKIEGYSAYLHPIAPGYLLGVGRDATDTGQVTGLQLSVFDVRDLSNPLRVQNYTLEGADTEVEWNHHAFLYWPATQSAVLPVNRWGWIEEDGEGQDDYFSGAMVFHVDAAAGISVRGEIEHLVTKHGNDDDWVDDEGIDPTSPENPDENPDEDQQEDPETDPVDPEIPMESWPVPLRRSVVVGNVLYTVSHAGLKGNAFDTLSELSWIEFPNW